MNSLATTPLHKLNKPAQAIYGYIIRSFAGLGTKTRWVQDKYLREQWGLSPEQLEAAQSELHRSGWLEIEPGLAQTRYTILEADHA